MESERVLAVLQRAGMFSLEHDAPLLALEIQKLYQSFNDLLKRGTMGNAFTPKRLTAFQLDDGSERKLAECLMAVQRVYPEASLETLVIWALQHFLHQWETKIDLHEEEL